MSQGKPRARTASRSTRTEVELDALPPHSIEAEQGVLGCIMLSPSEVLPLALREIGPEHFYDLRHRTLFIEMAAMHRAGIGIDTTTLQNRLRDTQQLDGIGGLAFLSELPDKVPSAANLGYYIEIVRDKYLLRKFDADTTLAREQL